MRRKIHFVRLADVAEECERLLESGYVKNGKWSLGQICRHMRVTIESNVNGYPRWMSILGYPLRPFLRRFALPSLLAGKSPKGISTAPMFVPPDGIDDAEEVAAFSQCIEEFLSGHGELFPHPGFGSMSRAGFEKFHAAHSAHHLSFLEPIGGQDRSAV